MPVVNRPVVIYLAAIAVANALVARYGPPIAIVNAFVFIGLDLSTRDQLHEHWSGQARWPRMLALISAGGLLSLLLGGSGRIALASSLAFILAGIADAISYQALARSSWLTRVNGSNLVAAAVDSLGFLLLAFGWPVPWSVALGQFGAKVLGGALWALVLKHTAHPPISPTHRRESR